jgi:hypothetical protein
LLVNTDQGPRQLDAILGPWQAEDFKALDPAWQRITGQDVCGGRQRAYLERPRGHSKTADLAVMVAWILFASPKMLVGIAAAADQDQARLLRDAMARLVSLNPWLAQFLTIAAYKVRNPHTGSIIEIIGSDVGSSYGLTPDFVVIDELTNWMNRDFWDSLLSATAKRALCVVAVISNAGHLDTWQWNIRESCRSNATWYFRSLEGPSASWITVDRLTEQQKILPPLAYRRLWLNEWTLAGEGDAITEAWIARAVRMPKPPTPPIGRPDSEGWVYGIGVDAGLRKDSTGIVVLRAKSGAKIELCETWLRKPQQGETIPVAEIVAKGFEFSAKWKTDCLVFDPWQLIGAGQQWAEKIPMVKEIPASGSSQRLMAESLLEAFREDLVSLYDDPNLVRDLHCASIREIGNLGGLRIDWPHTAAGHCDLGAAFAMLLPLALATVKTPLYPPELEEDRLEPAR